MCIIGVMKTYPEHSVVRIHTSSLCTIKKLSEVMKMTPPDLIDEMVVFYVQKYFHEELQNIIKEREEK